MTSDYAVLVDISPYSFSDLLVVHISLLNANNELVEKCIRMTQEERVYDTVSKIILRHTKNKKIAQKDSTKDAIGLFLGLVNSDFMMFSLCVVTLHYVEEIILWFNRVFKCFLFKLKYNK